MEAHWTYENRKDVVGDLVQGDILSALELRSSFGDNNLFFQNAEHIAFVVITQTCDLVRRSE